MAVDLKVNISDAQISQGLENLRLGLPLNGDMSGAMKNLARILKTGAQLRFRSQVSPEGTPWKPSRRVQEEGGQTLSLSGRLRRSLTTASSRTTATVGTNDIRAAIHQFGGVIRAKKGSFLSIPVTDAARQAGSPRNFPAELAVAQTLKGQFILVSKEGTTHYILKRQVVMPARPFLGASEADKAELLQSMDRYLASAWRR